MKAESLSGCLTTLGIPAELVSIGAERDEAWCLVTDESGHWDVFWRERGSRYDWSSFEEEAVACHYLFGRLAWAQVTRGAVGLVDAEDTGRHRIDVSGIEAAGVDAAEADAARKADEG